jgi:hypothetical protein
MAGPVKGIGVPAAFTMEFREPLLYRTGCGLTLWKQR